MPHDLAARELQATPLPARDHRLCRLALFPIPVEPTPHRGNALRARDPSFLRDRASLGSQIRPGFRSPAQAKAAHPQRNRHLDEVVVSIAGKKHWLWRAVDQEGYVLDEI